MKKIITIVTILLVSMTYSQIVLTKLDGTIINNGDVVGFSQTGFPSGQMNFKVRNTGTSTTNVWVKCESLVNNDGTNFELCFGEECLADMILGQIYPSVGVTLAPNAINGNFDHFKNVNTGSGVFPMDYVFRFFQTNQNTQGGAEVGNSITMTYRYNPALSNDEINQLETSGVIVKSTVVSSNLTLDVLKNTSMSIYDLNGKIILNKELSYGIQSIDVSNFSSGVYVINFTSNGATSSKKFVKE